MSGWFLTVALSLFSAANPIPEGATTLQYYDFRSNADRSFQVPEGWTRAIQPGYPFFVDAELTDEEAAVADRSLAFRLNGGHCAFFSPLIQASDDYNYIVQGQIKTVGLVHDVGFLLLEFLDSRKRVVGKQHLSAKIGGTQDWTTVSIGPASPPSATVRYLRIACFSQHGSNKDLQGTVYFDDLWIGRLPRIQVGASTPYRLFDSKQPKKVSVEVSGLEGRQLDALFHLYDEQRRPLAEHVETLSLHPDDRGNAEWELPIAEVGFYHLDIALREKDRPFLNADYPVTVVRSPTPVHTDFGLSSPPPNHGLEHLERLLTRSACRWLKLPLWNVRWGADDGNVGARSQQFALLLERLEEQGHDVIGAMEQPPDSLLEQLPQPSGGVADVFQLPKELWSSEIEGLQAMYGLKITEWQVGADFDTSFEGLPDSAATLATLKREMELFGRDLNLGVPWSWHVPPPRNQSVGFLSLTDAPPFGLGVPPLSPDWAPLDPDALRLALTETRARFAAEATAEPATPQPTLPGLSSPAGPKLWIQLTPLSQTRYGRQAQILDLFFRILAAKEADADRIFCTQIADPDSGLYDAAGAPTELFTIWRTAAEHLGGRAYQGRLFTGEAENRIFSDGASATAVFWANGEQMVSITTGAETSVTDLWGRSRLLPGDGITHAVQVGPWPILLTGCNGPLLRLQMETRFAKGWISSELGRHTDELIVTNAFPLSLNGTLSLEFPPDWNARPTDVNLQLQPGATQSIPIIFDIPPGASQGAKMVTLKFDVSTDRRYEFKIERPYRLGLNEIDVASQTRLLSDGDLEVRVAIANLLEQPLSLRCLLRAYNRNVVGGEPIVLLPPQDVATRVFIVPDGSELAGRSLKLELHQTNGTRQFNIEVPVNLK